MEEIEEVNEDYFFGYFEKHQEIIKSLIEKVCELSKQMVAVSSDIAEIKATALDQFKEEAINSFKTKYDSKISPLLEVDSKLGGKFDPYETIFTKYVESGFELDIDKFVDEKCVEFVTLLKTIKKDVPEDVFNDICGQIEELKEMSPPETPEQVEEVKETVESISEEIQEIKATYSNPLSYQNSRPKDPRLNIFG